jgi:hypothetical protein
MVKFTIKPSSAQRNKFIRIFFRYCIMTVIVLTLFGCSLQRRSICNRWMSEGDFYSTMDSCEQCVAQLGSGSKDAVKGCAMGVDATGLLGGFR